MHCEEEPKDPEEPEATQKTVVPEATQATQVDTATEASLSLLDTPSTSRAATARDIKRPKRYSPEKAKKRGANKDTKTTKCVPNPKRRRMSTRNSYSADSELIDSPDFERTNFGSDATTPEATTPNSD